MQLEGIFRINAENSQEEYVRDQLNSGVIPDGVDVHCLAGLIKVSSNLFWLFFYIHHTFHMFFCESWFKYIWGWIELVSEFQWW